MDDSPLHNEGAINPPLYLENIPDELKQYAQWVLWKAWERNNKRTKVPVNAKTGENASVSDPSTWTTYELIVKALKSYQHQCSGIGFVFTSSDPYVGVDLDNCRNPETGEIEDWAQDIINRLNTYTEISQSGKGIHCILKGQLVTGGRRKGSIEIYETGRYFVLTGNHLPDTPKTIEDRDAELTCLHKEIFAEEHNNSNHDTSNLTNANKQTSISLTDQELLARAIKAQNGAKFEQLWNGEAGEYQSNSEGDLALCGLLAFWTGKDMNRIDKLFRQSERYRPKWDTPHFSDGKTYGQATIEKAIANTVEVYKSRAEGGSVSFVSEVGVENKNIVWQNPESLPTDLLPVPKMTLELIPLSYREWIKDISERMQCPIEFVIVAAIVATASVVGNTIGIKPKRWDNWIVIVNLWGAVIGRPGILKTPALTEALKPIHRLIAKAKKDFEVKLNNHNFNQLVLEAKKKKFTEDLKRTIKSGQSIEHLRDELIKIEDESPKEKRYITNDATIEKLGELLNQNPKGLLLYRDELTGWLESLERDGRESDRPLFLESWNGYGSYVFDRIGRGTITISCLTLSILGGIQPGPLSNYLHSTLSGGMKDDGLLQRFQMMVYPDIDQNWSNIDRPPNNGAKNQVYQIFEKLDQLDPAFVGASIDPDTNLAYLQYDEEAQVFFDNWRADLETTLRSNQPEHPALEAHLSKYRSLMPSLSLIFHLIDYCDGQIKTNAISLRSAQLAAAWCSFLFEHAKRIYGMAIRSEISKAKTIASHIQKGDLSDPFTIRDIYRRCWSRLTKPQDCLEPLEILEELQWIKSLRLPSTNEGGRPTIVYQINPKLKEVSNEKLSL